MKLKNLIILTLVFLFINIGVYTITEISSNQRISSVLKNDLKNLKTHFDILNTSQKNISYAISKSIIRNTDIIEFLSKSYSISKEQNQINRAKLYEQLKEQYQTARKQGVLQIQFVDKNNISYLRVHKPSKFGDDLSDIRQDFKIVNQTKKPIRGFTQGRTAHGFRNTFPLFDTNNNHIGAMEVSFSSEKYQWYLNSVSQIHSHFLVDKHLFDSKTWKRKDLVIKYNQSSESEGLMLSLSNMHSVKKCIINNKEKLSSKREMIDKLLLKEEKFNFYTKYNNEIEVISFLPIKNLSNKTVAWIVSYTKSEMIESVIRSLLVIRLLTFILSLFIVYLIIRQIKSNEELKVEKEKSEKQHAIVKEILDTTDNIVIITDLKDIKYSNKKFKQMMMLDHTRDFNEKSNHNMISMFIESNGYLHAGLLKDGKTFLDLYNETNSGDKKVLMLDGNFELKAYSITVKKLIGNSDYLITLTDISELQEQFKKIENKAYLDNLTGVYNRNKFDELLEKELKRLQRYNESLSIAVIDIDKFKSFNDTYGHLIGDEVLVTMAHTVNKNIRSTDVFARWGGEEFVILFIDTAIDKAKIVAEHLKDKIEENEHQIAGKITASFGVTQYKESDTIKEMFERCDEALYNAKAAGRNRVEIL